MPEPKPPDECPMCLDDDYKCYAHAGPEAYRCSDCGYTQADAAFNMDHRLCEAAGGPLMPKRKESSYHA